MRPLRSMAVLLAALALCLPAAAPAAKKADAPSGEKPETRLTAETFAGLELRSIGPALMAGRIADIAIDPRDQSTWYVAVGSGGVWKTTNAATTWTPVFEHESSYSIGCVAVDPNRSEVVWVGTGENVGGRHVGFGDGVYKSLDGGATWENVGLGQSEHIGRILVDPRDSDVVYVAAQGPLWTPGGDRGLFKTSDGGKTWANVLAAGPYTGVNDVVMDPRDPDVLYASTHQRQRTVAALVDGGPESGIHKSDDGGATWRRLTNGLPDGDMGKIGLAVSPLDPDVVYATIELGQRKGGFYRSADAGGSWEKRSDYVSGGTGPHYYQEIYASPHKLDRVYQADPDLHVTEDGGKTFVAVGEEQKHGDNHVVVFDRDDPDYLLTGSDGGLYESWDLGKTWKFVTNLPVTQFYKVALDNDTPFYNIYGGTQDNFSQGGPSRTLDVNGIRSSDWIITLSADGHQPAVDPSNPDIVYCESQQGFLWRYDRPTGEVVLLRPLPGPGEVDRFNWDSPILISPHDPARLYYASQRVWRSDDRGDRWRPISGDLSRGRDRLLMPLMGRVWSYDAAWDLVAMSNYGTVTSLAESPLVDGLLYAGTDDGLIQVSEDAGATWRKVESFPGVPAEAFVNDVKADLFDADTVYAAFDAHKFGDFRPYLLESTDRGRTWRSIAGDLPDRHLVWRLVQDHEKPELLFAGTEFGIFFTLDGGGHWIELTGGVPHIPFRDLAVQRRENDLVGASFGRGFYVFDDYSPLREMSEEALAREAELFPVKDAWWYVPRRPLGAKGRAYQGADYFVAPNPPFGAVFTYYLRDALESLHDQRRDQEKELEKAGKDTPYPGWDAIRKEEHELAPAIVLTVRDEAGEVVRRVQGPVTSGFHRVAWDLHYPSLGAGDNEDPEEEDPPPAGPLAAPGTYSVSLAKRVDGVETDLGLHQTFDVVPLTETALPRTDPAEAVATLRQVEELRRAVTGAVEVASNVAERLAAIRGAVDRSTLDDPALGAELRALETRLQGLRETLEGDDVKGSFGEPTTPSISRRLNFVRYGNQYSTYGATPNHKRSIEIARDQLDQVREGLRVLVEVDLAALEKRLDDAGVPWTPGRLPSGGLD